MALQNKNNSNTTSKVIMKAFKMYLDPRAGSWSAANFSKNCNAFLYFGDSPTETSFRNVCATAMFETEPDQGRSKCVPLCKRDTHNIFHEKPTSIFLWDDHVWKLIQNQDHLPKINSIRVSHQRCTPNVQTTSFHSRSIQRSPTYSAYSR